MCGASGHPELLGQSRKLLAKPPKTPERWLKAAQTFFKGRLQKKKRHQVGFIQIGGVAGAGDTLSDGGLVQTSAEYSERVKVGHNSGSLTCSRRR